MNGKTLRYIRKALGQTIHQYAQRLDVAPSTVYKWEAGVVSPPKVAQKRIQTKLNITQEDIEEVNRLLLEQRNDKLDAKLRAQAGVSE
ncbi:transcriptional regulator [Bacillus cereus]|nr:transcriptional regulator [Bacillus cereus]